MGSIEVYDYQQMKWVPHVPKSNAADRNYEGRNEKDASEMHGRDSTLVRQLRETEGKLKEAEDKLMRIEERAPKVKQVTDVAEAIERAQSEVKRERKKERTQQRKKPSLPLPKRVRKLTY